MANEKRSDGQIRMMREYRAGGWTQAELAFFFSMSEGRVSEIVRGKCRAEAGGLIDGDRVMRRTEDPKHQKLNEDKVKRAKALRDDGFTHQQIADAIGVSKATVGSILRGETKFG